MKKILLGFSFSLTIIGLVVSGYFFYSLSKEYCFYIDGPLKMSETGQVGDFIGGIVGTLFALAGTFLIYLSFREQTSQNRREAFEAAFFEMIRLHRDNVSELSYTKPNGNELTSASGRKVFREVFLEFSECYREVKKFFRSTENILTTEYQSKIAKIVDRVNPQIKTKELAMIDIAYSIVFFGMSEEGVRILRYRFKKRYLNAGIFELLEYMRLKPKQNDNVRYQNWVYIRYLSVNLQRKTIKELYDYRRMQAAPKLRTSQELDYLLTDNYKKYYGGHQHRLGHYFRHLFQTYKYLNNSSLIERQRYFYAKTLRAQLSTYEQVMLFVNSISSLGMKWELDPEIKKNKHSGPEGIISKEISKNCLITKYHLIKNLPGESILDLKYKSYYPNVCYESEE